MPEGDSYARAAMRLRPLLVGRVVREIDGAPAIRKSAPRVVGHTVGGVRTHGKHLLVDVDNEWSIHVWLGMTGRFVIGRAGRRFTGERPSLEGTPTGEGAVRLRLVTDAGTVLVYAAPTVEIERRRVLDERLASLGPDVLSPEFDWDTFEERARAVAPDRTVAEVVLDQRVMAGIGNEYKSEILFLERLHPSVPFGRPTPEQVRALVERAITVMSANARRATRRTTAMSGRGRESWVYGRAGKPCRRCRTRIESAELGSRRRRITYWCPHCQPALAD